jgi:conjugal transfer pilus assembly protein TraW
MHRIIAAITVLLIGSASYANNLGVWGTIYPIAEQDIKEFIYARLNQMQQNGELDKLQQKFPMPRRILCDQRP